MRSSQAPGRRVPRATRLPPIFGGGIRSLPGSEVVVNATKEVQVSGLRGVAPSRGSRPRRLTRSPTSSSMIPRPERSSWGMCSTTRNARRPGIRSTPGARRAGHGGGAARSLRAAGHGAGSPSPPPARRAPAPDDFGARGQEGDAFATRAGFISGDGATLMLGEFRPSESESPTAFRAKLLGERARVRVRAGVSPEGGMVLMREPHSPDARRAPPGHRPRAARSNPVHSPWCKQHAWAFAAAESAAALGRRQAGAVQKVRGERVRALRGVSIAAARELATDIAAAAGAGEAYAAEIASGRAPGWVLSDVGLRHANWHGGNALLPLPRNAPAGREGSYRRLPLAESSAAGRDAGAGPVRLREVDRSRAGALRSHGVRPQRTREAFGLGFLRRRAPRRPRPRRIRSSDRSF